MGSKLAIIRWRWPSFRDVASVSVEPAGTAERRLGLLTAIALVELLGRRRRAAAASGGG
jgi:MYXO-CTERM domain-containing protein